MTTPDQHAPTHGFTKFAQAVHKRTVDHLPARTAYQRFNKRVALALTRYVGTMTCFWIFCLLALCSLPAVLSGFSVFRGVFPAVIIKASIIALVAWVAQTLIQLVLLPALPWTWAKVSLTWPSSKTPTMCGQCGQRHRAASR